MTRSAYPAVIVVALVSARLLGQDLPPPAARASGSAEFEVVSIKRNVSGDTSSRMRNSTETGEFAMTNMSLRTVIIRAYPPEPGAPVDPLPGRAPNDPLQGGPQMVALPSWVDSERYDVVARAEPGASREDQVKMWRAVLADRMKLAAHYERREEPSYNLVLARADRRLGPQLRPSALECSSPGARVAPGPAPPGGRPAMPTPEQASARCGFMMTGNNLYSGGVTIAALAPLLRPAAGRIVVDRTGLEGYYAVTLTFARNAGAPTAALGADDAPSIFSALPEQLGLKLEPDTTQVQVLVIDHIERPTEN